MFVSTPRRITCAIVVALLVVAQGRHTDAVLLTFDAIDSVVNYTHDLDSAGTASDSQGPDTPMPAPSGLTYTSPGLSGAGLFSTARAGLGHTSSPFSASAVVAPGTNVTQTDTNSPDSAEFSRLTVDFENHWSISNGNFSPVITNFSMPVYAVVPPGGAAVVDVDVEWGRRDSGGAYTRMWEMSSNPSFPSQRTYTATTIENMFIPGQLIPGQSFSVAEGNDFVVRGSVTLEAENTNGPVSLTLDPFTRAEINYRFDQDGSEPGATPEVAFDSAPLGGEQEGIYGGEVTFLVPGLSGLAAAFRPDDYYYDTCPDCGRGVTIPPPDGLSRSDMLLPDQFTVDFWMRNDTSFWHTGGSLVEAIDVDGRGFSIETLAGTPNIMASIIDTHTTIELSPSVQIQPNTFHHVALTVQQDTPYEASLYFDGELVVSEPISSTSIFGFDFLFDLLIGGTHVDIDEFNLITRALDELEIANRFTLGRDAPDLLGQLPTLPLSFVGGFIPEPSVLSALAISLAALSTRRRRKP
ncbi:MAG: hypothetical protein CMJ18_15475 [Phycisphaeraceae bacterium]|nr:hypothetical protein [Phycisphaeraceae bacterium]